ncbi:deacetoxyvindoline 4-hydroxylase-like [Argentina anserina]|uniref:deacetoxyvindoline 4-hydroxylase-like n=1 Tax=Argentina anserina TaxID=57926 RepID=UPI0021763E3E|nr:deacetoxyvindoline 4-hydroxylase-like [Potentilla anserina]
MEVSDKTQSAEYNRALEVKRFDDTKAGVKGLVDAGVGKVPKIFIAPSNDHADFPTCQQPDLLVPVINLGGLYSDRHKEIVNEVRIASEKWGFFQVVNHGIPLNLLEGMIQGVKKFNEQALEVKKQFYSRDLNRTVRFNSNYDLYQSKAANWRDTLAFTKAAVDHDPQKLPQVCREVTLEYANHVVKLGDQLFGLLSEALELSPDYLTREMECAKFYTCVCHYYPVCPEPELTLGAGKHSDPAFLTILLQDEIGGLQILHENQWVNVDPISGGLVVNIGDFLQAISNDKLKSVQHRVLANRVGPRVSVAYFLKGEIATKPYGPIKELVSDENPPVYKEFSIEEYQGKFFSQGLDEKSTLDHFKL